MAGVQIDGVNNKIDFDDDLDTSISANTDDTLVIEAGGNTMATITATTFTINDGTTITTADNTDTLSLISTDADALVGPVLRLFRNSASPADDDVIGNLIFSGQDGAGNETDFLTFQVNAGDVANGAEDGFMRIMMPVASTSTEFIRMNPAGFVFNEGSADLDFRVESNALTHAFFIDGGTDHVSMGNSSTSLYTLDVKQNADFTGSNSDTANEAPLRVWSTHNNGRGAIAIGGNNNNGIFNKGANDLVVQGYNSVTFDVSTTNDDKFGTKTERFRISSTGKLSTGAETDTDVGAGGLTLQQNADDGKILTFKSSDVAHGITAEGETDTFGFFQKASATKGGLYLRVLAEDMSGERFVMSVNGEGNLLTGKATNQSGGIELGVNNKNGTGVTSVNSDGNLLVIRNYTNTQFIFDAEGTFHSNVGTATYDEYDDAQLVRAMDLSTSTKGLIASKFDDFVKYNHEDLAAAKIVGREDDGTPNSMVNWTAMSQLHNGAIWQQYEKTQRLTNAMYELAKAAVGEEKANEILEQNEIKLLN